MEKINIYLLGASGSIGSQTIDVIRQNKDIYNLEAISVGTNISKAIEIIEEFDVKYVSVINEVDCNYLKGLYKSLEVGYGLSGLIKAATYNKEKKGKLINAVVGYSGLIPTIEAIKIGRDILLANKETLVCAGSIIKDLVKKYDVNLLPIDSEHSAIFQALHCGKKEEVKNLIITASGGSFRDKKRSELKDVTLADALKHPNWVMGAKITIDSATMVNKGLEIIEAHYLFDIDYNNIKTIIHPQSIIHSIVEYIDNSQIAQLATSDMRIPIQYALTYPNRCAYNLDNPLDLTKVSTLTFKPMDFDRYPMVKLAYEVGVMGGVMPAVYNIANEVANELFRKEKIEFLEIESIITKQVGLTQNIQNPTIDDIIEVMDKVKQNILNEYGE